MKSNRVYRYLTSIKLTIILLTAMAICFVLDTVFEAVHLIHSVPMYIMAALFAVNLTLCTLKRTEWAAKKSALKFDPAVWGSPVLHIGLIVIIMGVQWLTRGWKMDRSIPVIGMGAIACVLGLIIACNNAATTWVVVLEGVGLLYTAIIGIINELVFSR